MIDQTIKIEKLFNQQLELGANIIKHSNNYEVIEPIQRIEILTIGNKYVPIKWLSRHKTDKQLIQLEISSSSQLNTIVVTTDHICMVYDRDRILQNINADNIRIGDYVQIYDNQEDIELIGSVSNIINLGFTDEYVYDLEVEDDLHVFYANDILVHNSQFIDLAAITNWLRQQKPDLPSHIHNWPKTWKQKLWDVTNGLVQEKINPYVRNLVKEYCHTTQSNVLSYELEYVSSIGIYEGKKHYATRKLFNEGDMVDSVKFAGIELKKAQVPKEMKAFLAEIYDGILLHDWSEMDYVNYTNDLYNKFSSFSIDDVSFWKGYNTERQAIGFLQMQVGTTGIAKACTYYNQIIDKMKLGKKYDEIRVGDKVRFCYIEPTNMYGINCIAYKPGAWPKEFDDIFKVDYHVMFNKIILDPLKRFREACKFENSDPSKQVVADIFSL